MMENPCVIIGGGGHAKVLIEILQLEGRYSPYAITDGDPSKRGNKILGIPIVGTDTELPKLLENNVQHFIVGTGSVGKNQVRKRLFNKGCKAGFEPLTALHPTGKISGSAHIENGTALMAGAIVNVDSKIGKNCVINSGAIVEHDCHIADHVYLSSGVCLSSTVKINCGAFLGIGATIKQTVQIGAWSIIGAGSVVLDDVPPKTIVAGVPAKIIKTKI